MKKTEIGSEFWLNSIPNDYNNGVPDWIKKFGDFTLTSSGRGAISLLLSEVQPKYKTALLPAYICNSIILPFVEQGYTCHFYDVKEDLTADLGSINFFKDIGVFLHMGYYGFPTNNDLFDIIKKLKTDDTIIIEDITHTLFSDYERFEENDFYISSIRKWTGLPSGGFLASPFRKIKNVLKHNELFSNIRSKALLKKADYIANADKTIKREYLDLFAKGEELLDNDLVPYDIDNLSKVIIGALEIDEIKEKRRSNFKMLLEGLKGIEYIEPIFTELPENVCPIFFPIYINEKRSEIRKQLIEENIYCPIHWPIPKQIECSNYGNANKIYKRVMSIPCDQRYEVSDMERIISALRTVL